MRLIAWLVVVSVGFGACEKADGRRAAVLADESKRILDLFDFSSFDNEEALGYIDRQRFEDLVRGKRSKWNLRSSILLPLVTKGGSDDGRRNLGEFDGRVDYSIYGLESGVELRREKRDNVTETTTEASKTSRIPDEKSTDKHCDDEDEEEGGGDDEDFEKELEEYEEMERRRKKKKKRKRRRRHWSKWSEWSPCSVTCGKGRKIRWRRCIAKKCPTGELEMGEKTCQLPACSLLDKLFSFFK